MDQEYEKEIQNRTAGTVAIRKALEDRGYTNIGYNENTGMVTIGGTDVIKPDYMDEAQGRSYAAEQTIADGLRAYRETSKDPLVRFTDHVASKGGAYGIDAGSIGFGNGMATLGGQTIKPEMIDENGKAWMAQSVADDMVNQYIRQTGLQNPSEMYNNYRNGAQQELQRDINRLQNREAFSYDPSQDEVFQSYLRQHQMEGNRAAENTAAAVSARTGGYMNSAAVTAAAQARNYYSQQAMSALPEFVEKAYQRYLQDYNKDVQTYERKRALYESDYNRAAAANSALRDNLRYTAASNEERDRYYAERNTANAYAEANAELQRRQAEMDLANGELDYQMKQAEAAYYPSMLEYRAMLEYQKWMQGDVAYQQGLAELSQKRTAAEYAPAMAEAELKEKQITADYAAARYAADLRYKKAQTAKLNRK